MAGPREPEHGLRAASCEIPAGIHGRLTGIPTGIPVSRRALSSRRVWAAGPAERPLKQNLEGILSRREGAASSAELVCAQASAPEVWTGCTSWAMDQTRLFMPAARGGPRLPSGASVGFKVALYPAQWFVGYGLRQMPTTASWPTYRASKRATRIDRAT